MNKIIRIGTIERHDIFCRIKFDDGRLSISGVVGPLPSGNARGGCGQIIMEFKEYDHRGWTTVDAIKPAASWDIEMIRRFFDAWNRWHLNDMKAGTPAQSRFLRDNPIHALDYYGKACTALADAGLNPDNGYFYGSKWLREKVPAKIISFFESLPDADKQPAWV